MVCDRCESDDDAHMVLYLGYCHPKVFRPDLIKATIHLCPACTKNFIADMERPRWHKERMRELMEALPEEAVEVIRVMTSWPMDILEIRRKVGVGKVGQGLPCLMDHDLAWKLDGGRYVLTGTGLEIKEMLESVTGSVSR